MYIAIWIIPLVCLLCYMPIAPYFFYAQNDLAQRLTKAPFISIRNINIYVELDDTEYTDINWEDTVFAI